jgi:VCBS repeat-containing protein
VPQKPSPKPTPFSPRSGQLALADLDATAAKVVAQSNQAGTYGKFSIDAAGQWSYATNDALNSLNAGQVVSDVFAVATTDGGSASVTVTITGSEDIATLTSATKTLTETNAVLSTSGQLVLADLDATAAKVVAQSNQAGTYGKFSIDAAGQWSYVTNDALNSLNVGQVVRDIFNVSTTDGGSASVTVTITGSEDIATLTSAAKALTETNAVLSTFGQLALADLDATAAKVVAQSNQAGTYGKFSIDAAGQWSYATNDALNSLNAGQVVSDIFSVATTDGGSASVTVTITGSEDIAALTSATKALTETNSILSTSGQLILADLDATAATVVAQSNQAGTYGKFSIDAAGQWSYATNDALNSLNAGQVVSDIFNVSTTDGGSASVTVTITGSEDIATLTSATKALTETNAVLSTSGQLILADLDATAATVVAQTNQAGTYGKFSIDTAGQWSYVTNDALNSLNAGQVVRDIFNVSTTDGGSASVTVTITGSEDIATLTSATKALTETNAVLSTSGQLILADLDATAATVVAQTNQAGTYGKFSIDAAGQWSYVTNDALDSLSASQVVSDIFNVSTTDGGSASVTVTITGSEDIATLTSAAKALAETNAVLSTSGQLVLADLDATAATVVAQSNQAGTYGKFSINAAGQWSYFTNDALNSLTSGQVVSDIFNVSTTDGGSASVTVTITGSEDIATLTSATKALTETNAVLSTFGQLVLADLDATAANVVAQTNQAGTYGKFSIDAAGKWSYATNDALNSLNAGQVISDIFNVSTTDGGSASVTVTITGSEDIATLTSAAKALTETNAVLSTSGQLVLADPDATAATVVAQSNQAGTYGKFSIDTAGKWSYATNDALNSLNAGQVVRDIFNVATSDGGTASVTVTITGSEDIATLTSDAKALTETNSILSTSGQLTLIDLDATAATVVAQSNQAGTYGKFTIDAAGQWSYVTNDALNSLTAGQVVSDIFNVSTTDGGTASVTVTITGSEDIATLTSAAKALTETNAVLSTSGQLVLADLDATAATVVAQSNQAGTYGKFSIDAAGKWSYATNDALNSLNVGQVVSDIFNVSTTDGGSASVTITIAGTNDGPVLGGGLLQATVTELSQDDPLANYFAHLRNGSISFTDGDLRDVHSVEIAPAGQGYRGRLVAAILKEPNGGEGRVDWTYSVADADLGSLDAGQVVNESYRLILRDQAGLATESQPLSITLIGSADVPVAARLQGRQGTALREPLPTALFAANGGNGALSYSLEPFTMAGVSYGVPAWLAINSTTGLLSGTPGLRPSATTPWRSWPGTRVGLFPGLSDNWRRQCE